METPKPRYLDECPEPDHARSPSVNVQEPSFRTTSKSPVDPHKARIPVSEDQRHVSGSMTFTNDSTTCKRNTGGDWGIRRAGKMEMRERWDSRRGLKRDRFMLQTAKRRVNALENRAIRKRTIV
jgi:hypothetical protein